MRRTATEPAVPGAASVEDQLAAFFAEHYERMVRLAGLVCSGGVLAEDAVQAAMEQGVIVVGRIDGEGVQVEPGQVVRDRLPAGTGVSALEVDLVTGDLDPSLAGCLDVHGIRARERSRLPGPAAIARLKEAVVVAEVQAGRIRRERQGVDNVGITLGAVVLGVVSLFLSQSQVLVDDRARAPMSPATFVRSPRSGSRRHKQLVTSSPDEAGAPEGAGVVLELEATLPR